jgi:hypothetical protein
LILAQGQQRGFRLTTIFFDVIVYAADRPAMPSVEAAYKRKTNLNDDEDDSG